MNSASSARTALVRSLVSMAMSPSSIWPCAEGGVLGMTIAIGRSTLPTAIRLPKSLPLHRPSTSVFAGARLLDHRDFKRIAGPGMAPAGMVPFSDSDREEGEHDRSRH